MGVAGEKVLRADQLLQVQPRDSQPPSEPLWHTVFYLMAMYALLCTTDMKDVSGREPNDCASHPGCQEEAVSPTDLRDCSHEGPLGRLHQKRQVTLALAANPDAQNKCTTPWHLCQQTAFIAANGPVPGQIQRGHLYEGL